MITKRAGQLILAVLMTAIAFPVFAQTGKIAGKITDEQTGEELIGASVLVVGTSLGAATDFEGNYNILNVPPGTYTLRVSYVGYTTKTISNIRVSIGLTARIDVALSTEVLTIGEEITITAERPMVQKDLTASTAIVSGDEINALPVTEISQVVSLQAGNVDGHFRGGRTGEVAYMIDGVPVTDKFDGSPVVDLNKNIVAELQVISGAFNAEYGQAMSAIINVATKDGSNKYGGSATLYYGDYITQESGLFAKEYSYNPLNIQNYEGTFSGPIIQDNLYFFAVGRYVTFGGHLYGKRKYNPDNYLYLDPVSGEAIATSPGDNAWVPMNNSSRISGQLKLTWPVSTSVKTSLNMIYEGREWKDYNRSFRLNPDGVKTNYQDSYTGILALTHTLTASTFYTVSLSGFNKFFENYLYEGLSKKYVHPNLSYQFAANTFNVGGTDNGQFQRESQSMSIKADLWSQVNNEHQIKTGFEYKLYMVDVLNRNVLPGIVEENARFDTPGQSVYLQYPWYGYKESLSYDKYSREPSEFSAYIQDKIEFSSFILNLGVRFDWFDPNGLIPNDLSDPDINSPRKNVNLYKDLDGNGLIEGTEFLNKKSLADREKYWWKKTTPKYQFSPRIGAAFPISDQGKIYFSYGHFYQFPNFDLLYTNANYKFSKTNGLVGESAGNSDLKPERNISMELGANQQITENTAIDATIYFRDYRDLSGTTGSIIDFDGGTSQYVQYVNADFAFIRGFILTFNQRMSEGLAMTLDYTFQIAKGTASDPNASKSALLGGQLPEVKLSPLSWDQTHTFNATVNYSAKEWGVSAISTFGSGLPYTPLESADASVLALNSEKKPSTINVDLRSYYNLNLESFGSVTLFARIYNLFDTRNENGVYNDSGRAGFTKFKQQAEQTGSPLYGINTLDEWFDREDFYSQPRRLEFGVTYNF